MADGDAGAGDGGAGDGGAGAGGGDWRAALPTDVQAWEETKTAADSSALWNQLGHMRSRLGNSITLPGEDASTEARTEFLNKAMNLAPELTIKPDADNAEAMIAHYRSMGMPEEAGGYNIEGVDLPEGVTLQSDAMIAMGALAHKNGLTNKQFKGFVGELLTQDIASAAGQAEKQKTDLTALNTEWGVTYDTRINDAVQIAEATGAPASMVDQMKAGGAPAEMYKYFHQLASQFGKEGGNLTKLQGDKGLVDPGTALDQINEIQGNKEHAYFNQADPGHQAALTKMRDLYKKAYPDANTTGGPNAAGSGGIRFT